jgi:hypothetical protein
MPLVTLPIRSMTLSPRAGRRRSRWQPLAFGVLWGVAVSAIETVVLPGFDGWSDLAAFALMIMPGWAAVGIVIAVLVELAPPRIERPVYWTAGFIVCALTCSAFWSWLYARGVMQPLASTMRKVFPHGNDPFADFAYQTWAMLFYGGFYCYARRLGDRAERTREVLDEVQVARMQVERRLADAQLQLLRGHLDPALLLRVMKEVERRYAQPETNADHLLLLLVSFLRLAVPAVQCTRSTLPAEIALARAYAELLAELDSQQTRWAIDASATPEMPFPALLLLPLLDACSTAASGPFVGRLCVTSNAGGVIISFHIPPLHRADWLGADLAHRLRVGLCAHYGNRWSMRTGGMNRLETANLIIELRPQPMRPDFQPLSNAGVHHEQD